MNFEGVDFTKIFGEEWEKMGVFNLALFGKTGVGKSTLINTFFATHVAATGIGEPVTEQLTYHRIDKRPFGFYDSPGFEVGQASTDLLSKLESYVREKRLEGIDRQIHAVWYCVRAADRRFEATQAEFVRSLLALKLPVILVMTQVNKKGDEFDPEAVALRDAIRDQFTEGPQPAAIVMVNALANNFTEIPRHGLEELLERTTQVVPEGVRQAFQAAQQVNLEVKRKAARSVIKTAAATAAAAGAQPIPLGSIGLLLPIEVAMLAKVSAVYGVPLDPGTVSKLAAAALGAIGLRTGATIALAQFLKAIPFIGTAAGGMLNAAAAGTLTMTMGRAWMGICEMFIGSDKDFNADDIAEAFKRAVREQPPGELGE